MFTYGLIYLDKSALFIIFFNNRFFIKCYKKLVEYLELKHKSDYEKEFNFIYMPFIIFSKL